MIIGIDFDNTIVAYDALFHRVAREQDLIPAEVAVTKTAVRDFLRAAGREDAWTALQGEVYGARMAEAEPFPGVIDFFQACRQAGITPRIISHKTRHPFLGARHDLHAAAYAWLESKGFFAEDVGGLSRTGVHFELTKSAKLARIAACACEVFIDDLPEILADSLFPAGVRKFLFDPTRAHASAADLVIIRDWPALTTRLTGVPVHIHPTDLARVTVALPARLAGNPEALEGGRNNRVYRLTGTGGERYLLKEYFSAGAGQRNRFQTERDFYHFAWDAAGVRCIPQPLGWDEPARLGVFELVEGRKILPGDVDAPAIDAALGFVAGLNASRHRPEAQAIGLAAEACFTTAEHLATIQKRLDRLAGLNAHSPMDLAAREFVHQELFPEWQLARADALRPLASYGAGPGDEASAQRCLSPSDFGFHNVLLRPDGRWVFFDFEYAGWDDPAKLVCDFFCQPDVPVPAGLFDGFAGRVARVLQVRSATEFTSRCRALLPVYRVKWCTIMLNEFLAPDYERRSFARGAPPTELAKEQQLQKARRALGGLRSPAIS